MFDNSGRCYNVCTHRTMLGIYKDSYSTCFDIMDMDQMILLCKPWQHAEQPEKAHLWVACRTGNFSHVCEIIKQMKLSNGIVNMKVLNFPWGPELNLYCTPLFIATFFGRNDIVRHLIMAGADVHAQGNIGCCPLHIASRMGYTSVVRALLKGMANVNCVGNHHTTPLHEAAKTGESQLVLFLIEQNANVWAQDQFTFSPLHYASKNQHKNTENVLLANLEPCFARTNSTFVNSIEDFGA